MIRVAVNFSPELSPNEQTILELPNRLRNLRPLMINRIAPAANEMLQEWWDAKGGAFGRTPWAEWAPKTLAARIRKGTVEKGILVDSEHLINAIFRARPADDRLRVISGGLRLQLNTSVPYASAHQFGLNRQGPIPIRQVIPDPLPETFKQTVLRLTRDFLFVGRVRDASGRFVKSA